MKEKIKVFGDKVRTAMSNVMRIDGWYNPFTGLGTSRDKSYYNAFEASATLTDEELEALYAHDDTAARICDVVPDEMTRKGFDLTIENDTAGQAEEIKDALTDLKVMSKFAEALTWARCFGAGAIWIGADDGARASALAKPLNESAIKKLDHLNVLSKRYMQPQKWYEDPTQPKYGYPETYMITSEIGGGEIKEVHESRLILFNGVRTTARKRQENNGWHHSVLQRCNALLTEYGISWSALTHILQDANQGVFKMKGLIEALAQQDYATIQARLELIDMGRSVARAVVLDPDDEDFDRKNFAFSGIEKPYELLMLRLSAAARMPVTIMMAQSPAGMDATGESDIRWFYDTVESARENALDPELRRLIKLVMLSKDGPTRGLEPDRWSILYPSLWQMTPKEEGEIRKNQAETDKIYLEAGVLLPEEVAISRFTADGWKPDTTIDLDTRRVMLESETEEMLNPPEPPPMPPPMPPPVADPNAPPPAPDANGQIDVNAFVDGVKKPK